MRVDEQFTTESSPTNWKQNQNRITHAALVYQGGIANVFRTGVMVAGKQDYERKRLIQGSFLGCEYFAQGLAVAGVDVVTLYCNEAGDIADRDWYSPLDDAPFSEKFSPVGKYAR